MKILIIVAMQDELKGILNKVNYTTQFYKGFDYHLAHINNHDVIIVKTEVGKVNAAILASTFILKFKPRYVINAGIGGSLHENLLPLTTIFATKTAYFDVDLTCFGLPYGQLDNMDLFFKTSKSLLHLEENDRCGLIVSSDSFVSNIEQKELILKHFPKALVCDMEGASIGHVCTLLKRKYMVIRTISDVVGLKDGIIKYQNCKEKAIDIVTNKVLNLIHTL